METRLDGGTYRRLRNGERGVPFSDAGHHGLRVNGGGSGLQTELFLVLGVLVRRPGHVSVGHGRRGAHVIDRHLLIVELLLMVGDVVLLLVIVPVRLFRPEKARVILVTKETRAWIGRFV